MTDSCYFYNDKCHYYLLCIIMTFDIITLCHYLLDDRTYICACYLTRTCNIKIVILQLLIS